MTVSLVDIPDVAAAHPARRSHSFPGRAPVTRFYACRGRVRSGILLGTALALAGGVLPACEGVGGAASFTQSLTATSATGSWEYLEAAVIYASGKQELAILTSADQSSGETLRRRYTLVTVRDERMIVDVDGVVVDGAAQVRTIEARLTPFRDEARERALVRAIENRITKLEEGGGVAPG